MFGRKRQEPQRWTSADYHREAVNSCPGHEYNDGDQISPTHVRWFCACGHSIVTESRPGRS